jgi:hypothetical protein
VAGARRQGGEPAADGVRRRRDAGKGAALGGADGVTTARTALAALAAGSCGGAAARNTSTVSPIRTTAPSGSAARPAGVTGEPSTNEPLRLFRSSSVQEAGPRSMRACVLDIFWSSKATSRAKSVAERPRASPSAGTSRQAGASRGDPAVDPVTRKK